MKKIIYFFLILCTSSCTSLIVNTSLKEIGAYDDATKIHNLSNGSKKVVFIGMHHIGRKEFYDDVSAKIDSLQQQDYVVFYESVAEEVQTDSVAQDRALRKLRKLLGFVPEDYLDTINNTFLGKYKYSDKYQLMNQPSYHEMSVDTVNAVKADLSISAMVSSFETKNGEIQLDDCDLTSGLNSNTYECTRVKKSLRKKFFNAFIVDFRNQHLANKIQDSEADKVVVIYGKYHLSGMVVELRKLDSAWDYEKGESN